MKFSKVTRFIYIFVWTGIFILSSYIIVKGSTGSVMAAVGERMLKEGSGVLDYYSGKKKETKQDGVSWLFAAWAGGSYFYSLETEEEASFFLEGEEEDNTALIVEYEKGNLLNPVPFISGESYYEEEVKDTSVEAKSKNMALIQKLKDTKDTDFLLKNFYIVDSTTSVDKKLFQVDKLLGKNMAIKKEEGPQILIFHTHGGSESFSDSRKNKKEDSVIGVGERLAEELRSYGYEVIHDETEYDRVNGAIDRNKAYNQSLEGVKKQMEKYPSIQVILDIHRDGVAGKKKRVTKIDGKATATLMMFNGLSRSKTGEIAYLKNDNLKGNLAFSLQMRLKAMELYPTLTTANYLKGYRYNMHLCERFLLVELGNQNSTVEEAKNAMAPLAKVLDAVLSGK